jgi:hypothetical protein
MDLLSVLEWHAGFTLTAKEQSLHQKKHSTPLKSKWRPKNNYQQEAVSNLNDRGFCKLIVKYIRGLHSAGTTNLSAALDLHSASCFTSTGQAAPSNQWLTSTKVSSRAKCSNIWSTSHCQMPFQFQSLISTLTFNQQALVSMACTQQTLHCQQALSCAQQTPQICQQALACAQQTPPICQQPWFVRSKLEFKQDV